MKKAYIAGPLFDDHERDYLEKIAQIVESYGISTFVPHRDAGLVTGDFTFEKKVKVFDVDMEYLEPADIVIALLTGRDVDSGTAAEIGYAYKAGKRLIGISFIQWKRHCPLLRSLPFQSLMKVLMYRLILALTPNNLIRL